MILLLLEIRRRQILLFIIIIIIISINWWKLEIAAFRTRYTISLVAYICVTYIIMDISYAFGMHCLSPFIHSRTIEWCSTRAVKVKQGHHQRVYPYSNLRHFKITFTYVFVSVLKTASYATGKLIVSSSNGLFHLTAL